MSSVVDTIQGDVLAFDIGSARTGVARISTSARLSEPLEPISMSKQSPAKVIAELIAEYDAQALVFGLPRGLDGSDTDQTETVKGIVADLIKESSSLLPCYFIDEAGTSKEADARIENGSKASRDSLAACVIAEDFVAQKDISNLLISQKEQ